LGADGFIVADLGLINAIIKSGNKVPIHVSTQANTTSAQTALVYADMGCSRVNLARELSFEKIEEIKEKVGDKIELEVFIHGSQCFSMSGRCAISDYLVGRGANRGACSQPCRWAYHLMEEKRDGSFMPVFEDSRGLYFFNSRDLALYDYAEKLQNIGITSLKIEGRMKTIHYLASVLPVYRQTIDGIKLPEDEIEERLSRISNRGYTKGFMKGYIDPEKDYKTDSANYLFTSTMVGHTEEDNILQVNNSIEGGEVLELIDHNNVSEYTMPKLMRTTDGSLKQDVNNSMKIVMPEDFPKYAILRRIIK
ncbi:MAG: U32 family peptidase, partial [Armatimonadetes bacterium]|nr:U32 family peptidase [Candidatus Hippobium faecium]